MRVKEDMAKLWQRVNRLGPGDEEIKKGGDAHRDGFMKQTRVVAGLRSPVWHDTLRVRNLQLSAIGGDTSDVWSNEVVRIKVWHSDARSFTSKQPRRQLIGQTMFPASRCKPKEWNKSVAKPGDPIWIKLYTEEFDEGIECGDVCVRFELVSRDKSEAKNVAVHPPWWGTPWPPARSPRRAAPSC